MGACRVGDGNCRLIWRPESTCQRKMVSRYRLGCSAVYLPMLAARKQPLKHTCCRGDDGVPGIGVQDRARELEFDMRHRIYHAASPVGRIGKEECRSPWPHCRRTGEGSEFRLPDQLRDLLGPRLHREVILPGACCPVHGKKREEMERRWRAERWTGQSRDRREDEGERPG